MSNPASHPFGGRAPVVLQRFPTDPNLTPPMSCLTDGLQTATGASLGRGTIKVATPTPPRAEAVFIKGTQRLRLRVKPAVQDRIRADVQRTVQHYGDRSPEYFREVRRLSLRYWAEMNRAETFDVDTD